MSISTADLKVIKQSFEDYLAASRAVTAAMSADDIPDSVIRDEERAEHQLLSMMRRYLPTLVNTCDRAMAVDAALVDIRSNAGVVDVRITLPDELTPGSVRDAMEQLYKRAWRSGVDKTLEVIQSKLR